MPDPRKVEHAINEWLAQEPPGVLSYEAEQRIKSEMPDGWEYAELTAINGVPRIAITYT